jgi:hypothetical protein
VRKSKGSRARERERERERDRKRKRRSKGKGKRKRKRKLSERERGKMGEGESSSDSSDSGRSDSSSDSSESSSDDEREYSTIWRKKAKTESKAKPVKPAKGKLTEMVISSDDDSLTPKPIPIDDAETQAELSSSDDGDDIAARSSMAPDSNDDRDTVTQPSVTTHTTLPSVMLLLPDATFVTLNSTLQQLARPILNPDLARPILNPDLMNLIAEFLTPPIYGTPLFKLYHDILNIDTITIIAEYTGEPLLPQPRASNYSAKQANIII